MIKQTFIGIDLGGTMIKGALIDKSGMVLEKAEIPTGAADGEDAVIARIAQLIQKLRPPHALTGCGIACPGLVDDVTGDALYMPNLHWNMVPLRKKLNELTGLSVHLVNDSDAAGLAEARIGSCRKAKNAVVLTIGTGIGGSIIADGKLMLGRGSGVEPGHMVTHVGGHLCNCGRKGCWERYASTSALLQLVEDTIQQYPDSYLANRARTDTINGEFLFKVVKEGDGLASYVLDRYYEELACGIANLANLLSPEIIAIGGGISGQGKAFIDSIWAKVQPQLMGVRQMKVEPKLVLCSLGNTAGAIGSALFAKEAGMVELSE